MDGLTLLIWCKNVLCSIIDSDRGMHLSEFKKPEITFSIESYSPGGFEVFSQRQTNNSARNGIPVPSIRVSIACRNVSCRAVSCLFANLYSIILTDVCGCGYCLQWKLYCSFRNWRIELMVKVCCRLQENEMEMEMVVGGWDWMDPCAGVAQRWGVEFKATTTTKSLNHKEGTVLIHERRLYI